MRTHTVQYRAAHGRRNRTQRKREARRKRKYCKQFNTYSMQHEIPGSKSPKPLFTLQHSNLFRVLLESGYLVGSRAIDSVHVMRRDVG
jgi:hypothetical protein